MKIEGNGLKNQAPQQKKDTVAEGLQRQIRKMEEEIAKLSQDENLTPEEKQKKKKELDEKVNGLRQQLQQHKVDKKKAEQEEKARKAEEQAARKEAEHKTQNGGENQGFSNYQMHSMVSASKSMKDADSIHHVRTQMTGDAHRLKGEIAVTESRDGDATELKSKLGVLEQKIGEVTGSLVKKYEEAAKGMKKAAELEREKKPEDDKEKEKVKDKEEEEKEKEQEERKEINLQI